MTDNELPKITPVQERYPDFIKFLKLYFPEATEDQINKFASRMSSVMHSTYIAGYNHGYNERDVSILEGSGTYEPFSRLMKGQPPIEGDNVSYAFW